MRYHHQTPAGGGLPYMLTSLEWSLDWQQLIIHWVSRICATCATTGPLSHISLVEEHHDFISVGFRWILQIWYTTNKIKLTTFTTKATLSSHYKRNFSAERAKVSNMELTLTLQGAPQVMLSFSLDKGPRMDCRVHRFLDIQPSSRISVELNVAEK